MSYCRFSSDDFACDIYAYADCNGGYTTHVAGNRIVGDIPKLEWPAEGCKDFTAFAASNRAQMAFLETAERKDIGLPHDGAMFRDATLTDFRARLVMLREVGYHFPDSVLEEVDAELAEEVRRNG